VQLGLSQETRNGGMDGIGIALTLAKSEIMGGFDWDLQNPWQFKARKSWSKMPFNLESQHDIIYVLLSNMFAKDGRLTIQGTSGCYMADWSFLVRLTLLAL
jgi:hypothetical protein